MRINDWTKSKQKMGHIVYMPSKENCSGKDKTELMHPTTPWSLQPAKLSRQTAV